MATNEESYALAVQRLNGLISTLDAFINGGEDATVEIGGVQRPTLSGALKELKGVRGVIQVRLVDTKARAEAIAHVYKVGTYFEVGNTEPDPSQQGFWEWDGTALIRPPFVEPDAASPTPEEG